jgi:beta-lactamase regulating signal transducer with metallopeptidase domain
MTPMIVEFINEIAMDWLHWAWPMLWQSAIVVLVVWAIDLMVRRRVRAGVRYALWMLVLVKLVLPPSLALPTGIGYWVEWPQAGRVEPAPVTIPYPISVNTAIDPVPAMASQDMPPAPDAETRIYGRHITLVWQGALYLAYVAGMIALGVAVVRRVFYVRRLISRAAAGPERVQAELSQLACRMGLPRPVELKVTHEHISPAVCGFLRPVVLVPTTLLQQVSGQRLRMVLMHELAHIRRADLIVNVFQTLLTVVYFFNPVVWAASAMMRRLREHAVDEEVMAQLGDTADRYGDTLLEVAEMAFAPRAASMGLLGVVESKRMLAQRIRHIAERGAPKCARCGRLAMAAVILLGLVLLPMACAADKEPAFTLKGRVTDAATGKPIAGAKVSDGRYNGGKFSAVTDKDGNYSYKTWYEEHNVDCNAPGYKVQQKLLETKALGKEKEKTIDFALSGRKRGAKRSTGTSKTTIASTGWASGVNVFSGTPGGPNDVPDTRAGASNESGWVVESVADGNNGHVRMYRRGAGAAGPMEIQAKRLEMQADKLRIQAEAFARKPEYLRGLTDEQKAQLKAMDDQRNELAEQARQLAKMSAGYKVPATDANSMEQMRQLMAQAGVNDEGVRHQMEDMQKQLTEMQKNARMKVMAVEQSSMQEFARASSEVGLHVDEYYRSRTEVVSRQTLGWQISSEPDGARTVEYQCRVKTRDGRSSKESDTFVFDKDGKLTSVKTKSEQDPLHTPQP